MSPTTMGGRIKKYRIASGLTQATLAQKVGTGRLYISHLETNHRRPSLTLLEKLAKALRVSMGVLLGER